MPLSMYIHHLYLPILLILHQLSYKNCVLKHHHLQEILRHLSCNRHYLVVTLKHQSNPNIHHSLKSHLLPLIFKTTSKSRTTNLNQRGILFLPILLLVPQLLPTAHLALRHLHPSHAQLVALMKFRELQRLAISHTLTGIVNRRNDTLSMDLRDVWYSLLHTSRQWPP